MDNLFDHKMRSFLTMLGMMFGVAAVIAMLSIGAGAEKQALDLIDSLGVRNIVLRSKDYKEDELKTIREKTPGLSPRDIMAFREAISEVDLVTPRSKLQPYLIASEGNKTEGTVYGVSSNHLQVHPIQLSKGRFIDFYDERHHREACVIGQQIKTELFGTQEALHKKIKINDVWCEVVGIISQGTDTKNIGDVELSSDADAIYIPYTTLLRKFEKPLLDSPLDEVVLKLSEGADPQRVSLVADSLLQRLHNGEKDYDIVVPEALLKQSQATQKLFNLIMGCIAGISLVVGGIGIMNIMLASVLEQTREIGIRRAVGAKKRDIRFQFLMSAFCLSMLGGGFGIALGLAISKIVAVSAGWPTVVTLSSIVLSTGVSVLVGLLSGFYPALRASNLEPMAALHHE